MHKDSSSYLVYDDNIMKVHTSRSIIFLFDFMFTSNKGDAECIKLQQPRKEDAETRRVKTVVMKVLYLRRVVKMIQILMRDLKNGQETKPLRWI